MGTKCRHWTNRCIQGLGVGAGGKNGTTDVVGDQGWGPKVSIEARIGCRGLG